MTTISTPVVHALAKAGFGTGTNELYDRARPSYTSDALNLIRDAVGTTKKSINVVEIGAGTGIFTRALLAHPEWATSISELKAVEPSEGMRAVFSKTVNDERVGVQEGTFDHTGLESGWADLVVIAQAFHWCPDHEAALKEFARVLKPHGIVVFIWNLEDRERARWVDSLRSIYEAHEQGSPQFRLGLWRAVFSSPSYSQLFLPPDEHKLSYNVPATLQSVQDRVCSKSYIAVLSKEGQEKVREDVRGVVERGEEMVWIDEGRGMFEYPYETFVVVLKRKPPTAE